MGDFSLIYCTSNREKPEFEDKIRKSLLKSSKGLPIVSVSQKPIDFGKNVCVGDIGASPMNFIKQILIGLKEATTRNIAIVCSDFLYPDKYFDIRPKDEETFYYSKRVYLLWIDKPIYFMKRIKEFMCISNRKHMMRVLEKVYKDKSENFPEKLEELTKQVWVKTPPLVTFKTREGMHWFAPRYKRKKTELKYWGAAGSLIDEYIGKG